MKILQHILLVEDDPHDVELTLTALTEHHRAKEVLIARDGVEALDYVYRRGVFAQRHDGDPIVILASSREGRDLAECYRLGVNAYVVKPVRFTEFVDTVKQLGVFWTIVNEPPPYCGKQPEWREPGFNDHKE